MWKTAESIHDRFVRHRTAASFGLGAGMPVPFSAMSRVCSVRKRCRICESISAFLVNQWHFPTSSNQKCRTSPTQFCS